MSAARCACGCGVPVWRAGARTKSCAAKATWADPTYRVTHAAARIGQIADGMRRHWAHERFRRQWDGAQLWQAWVELERQIDLDALTGADQRRLAVWLTRLSRSTARRAYQNGYKVGKRGGVPSVPTDGEAA